MEDIATKKQQVRDYLNNKEEFNKIIDDLLNTVDFDENNEISEQELVVLLTEFSRLLSINPPRESDIKKIFENSDHDKCGALQRDEFGHLIKRLIEYFITG